MILEIEKKSVGSFVVLEMAGRITLGRDCQQIEAQVEELVRAGQSQLVFDLGKVKYMDSTGIGILVMCSGKIKDAGGQLRLAGATGVVQQTLTLTQMGRIVPTYATLAEALQEHSAGSGQGSGA